MQAIIYRGHAKSKLCRSFIYTVLLNNYDNIVR